MESIIPGVFFLNRLLEMKKNHDSLAETKGRLKFNDKEVAACWMNYPRIVTHHQANLH
jgi:hypothetical protein